MLRRIYISSFIILAFLCVPIYFYYYLASFLAPAWVHVWMISVAQDFDRWTLLADIIFVLHLSGYLWAFYFCARKTFQLGEKFPPSRRLIFYTAVLSVIFCLSFLKVNYRVGFIDETPTETAWDILQDYTSGNQINGGSVGPE